MLEQMYIHKCRYLLKIKILISENILCEILKLKKTWYFDLMTDYN